MGRCFLGLVFQVRGLFRGPRVLVATVADKEKNQKRGDNDQSDTSQDESDKESFVAVGGFEAGLDIYSLEEKFDIVREGSNRGKDTSPD